MTFYHANIKWIDLINIARSIERKSSAVRTKKIVNRTFQSHSNSFHYFQFNIETGLKTLNKEQNLSKSHNFFEENLYGQLAFDVKFLKNKEVCKLYKLQLLTVKLNDRYSLIFAQADFST